MSHPPLHTRSLPTTPSFRSAREPVCLALAPFGTSIFTEMTALSNEHGAVNLSQGFPDFDGPQELLRLAAQGILDGPNQYSPSPGVPELRRAISQKMSRFYGCAVDADQEVTVTAGATEGLAATLLGLLDPGDEVILFEPFYDLYPAIVARAGARAVIVPLDPSDFSLDEALLARAFSDRTRAVLINNPHNPSGKVFTRSELSFIADLCLRHGAVAIGDEVYEHILYDGRQHHTLRAIPGLEEQSIVISSTGKTFSMTGWKVGTVVASPPLTRAVRAAHQFLTFATPAPLQRAMAVGIDAPDAYYEQLARDYDRRRTRFCSALERLGLEILWPQGSYYASLRLRSLGWEDDLEFSRWLCASQGVATIPFSVFYQERRGGRDLVRLCFCKRDETLDRALERLARWRGVTLPPQETP